MANIEIRRYGSGLIRVQNRAKVIRSGDLQQEAGVGFFSLGIVSSYISMSTDKFW